MTSLGTMLETDANNYIVNRTITHRLWVGSGSVLSNSSLLCPVKANTKLRRTFLGKLPTSISSYRRDNQAKLSILC